MAGLFEADIVATDLQLHEQGDALIRSVKVDTPFTKMVKKGKTQMNKLASWGAYFPSDGGDIGRKEGEDKLDGFGSNVPVTLRSVVQLNRSQGWMLTDLAKRTSAAYARSEAQRIAQQKASDGEAFLQMREKVMLSAQTPILADDAGDGKNRTTGAFTWLNPTQPGTLFDVPAKCRLLASQWHSSTLAALTETVFRDMMAATAERIDGTSKWTGIVGLALARQMSSWAGLVTTVTGLSAGRNLADETLKNVVTSFKWPEGQVDILTSFRLLCSTTTGAKTAYSSRSGMFIDPEMWRLAAMQPIEDKDGLDQGGGPRGWWEDMFVLQCLQPMNQFAVYVNS